MPVPEIIWFVAIGLMGGLSYVIMVSESWDDFKKFSSHKRIMLGAIIGFLYFYLHSDYNWPNAIMTWASAYLGPTFIDQLIEKRRRMAGVETP